MQAIMVMFDSLKSPLLEPYGCDFNKTPNFSRLAKKRPVLIIFMWEACRVCLRAGIYIPGDTASCIEAGDRWTL